MNPTKESSLTIAFLSSLILHGFAIAIAALAVPDSNPRREDFLPISLVEPTPDRKTEGLAELSKPTAAKVVKRHENKKAVISEVTHLERPMAPMATEEVAKPIEARSTVPMKTESSVSASNPRVGGGGSEAGAGNLFARGDVGIVPGSGIAGGGGGTAASGLGRGAGVAGLPAQTAVLRTNREAKPIQTARASYPAIALRMGLESDVTLKIEVDSEGRVTKAEITKSGGVGFDEEALKAVKQSRFEPAQRDGQNIPAEFTYIYRFRLQR